MSGTRVEPRLAEVLSVLSTPFHLDGSLDEASLHRLVDHQLAWGVNGIVVVGLAGEIYKLSDDDRPRILSSVVQRVDGAVPVIAGSEHSGTEAAAIRSREAVELGADALMVYPPTFVKPDANGVKEYYRAIAESTTVPIIIQDAPAWTGVPLSIELLAELGEMSPRLRWVKVEAPPAASKMRSLRSSGFHVFSGCGALHIAEDLRAGIEGFMPGCALPGLYLDIWRSHQAGDERRSLELYERALPLLVFQMSSLDVFVAVQKTLLHRIGVIESPRLRRPGVELDDDQRRWLDGLVDRAGLEGFLSVTLPRAQSGTELPMRRSREPREKSA